MKIERGQASIFDGEERFKIDKPIRLIELFAGYGSQALALKYLEVKFEHYKICEWAINSIQAYKDMHFGSDNTDYSAELSREEVFESLFDLGISSDYSSPMTFDKIKRMGEKKARKVYNNIKATHNLVSVCNVKGRDLEITETDKYAYILTWSFPCQDLSAAGGRKGIVQGSGTRSSLGWEVIRILKECRQRPQVLVMENVPQIIGSANREEFGKMVAELSNLGYTSKYSLLNATEFDVPQNRERCFMVSLLNGYYDFPRGQKCERKLKDVLETNVEEKYYLSSKAVLSLIKHKEKHTAAGHGFGWAPIDVENGGYAKTITAEKGYRTGSNFIIERGGANGIDIGKSDRFFWGELKDKSRTLRTDNTNGVVIWEN